MGAKAKDKLTQNMLHQLVGIELKQIISDYAI